MICAHPAEREYPSGQRAWVRLGNHLFDSWHLHGKEGCYAIFFSIFSSDQRAQRPKQSLSTAQGY